MKMQIKAGEKQGFDVTDRIDLANFVTQVKPISPLPLHPANSRRSSENNNYKLEAHCSWKISIQSWH